MQGSRIGNMHLPQSYDRVSFRQTIRVTNAGGSKIFEAATRAAAANRQSRGKTESIEEEEEPKQAED